MFTNNINFTTGGAIFSSPAPVNFCSNCGTKREAGGNYCGNCGRALASGNPVWPSYPQPIYQPIPAAQPCLFDGLPPGAYNLSCPCPRCSPRCGI